MVNRKSFGFLIQQSSEADYIDLPFDGHWKTDKTDSQPYQFYV